MPFIHYRIVLDHENTREIVEVGAGNLPSCGLDDLNNKRAIRTDIDTWEFK
ncbi:MAG TPA: hypothetical protein V6C93_34230 [Allocoleopsis sp.]